MTYNQKIRIFTTFFVLIILLFTYLAVKAIDNGQLNNLLSNNSNSSFSRSTESLGLSTNSKSGPSTIYPNPDLTPGEVYTNITKEDICTSGYSSRVRDVPLLEKKQVYQEYNISYPQPQGAYEVDHFISLELGGSNDIKNLWPEPSEPRPGFHEKDKTENYLHAQICNNQISLKDAQDKIRNDWYKIYLEMGNSD